MFCYENQKNALVIRMSGELDHDASWRMRGELDRLIDEIGPKQLIFDLNGLDFMDSSGIGLIIGRYKRMRRRGGSVAVSGTGPRVDKIFRMSGLYQLVERLA